MPHLQCSQPHSINSEANTLFPCGVPGHTPKARSSSSEARRCSQRRTPPGTEIRTKLAHFCIFQYRSYCLAEWDVLLSLFNIAVRTKRKLCVPECSVLQRSSFIPVSCLHFSLTPSIFLNSSFGSTWLTPLCQFPLKKFLFSSSLWRPFQSRYFRYLPQSSEHSSVYFRVISCILAPV